MAGHWCEACAHCAAGPHTTSGVQQQHTFMAWLGTSVRSATSVVPRMMDHIGSTKPSHVYLQSRDAQSHDSHPCPWVRSGFATRGLHQVAMRRYSELSRRPETAGCRQRSSHCCSPGGMVLLPVQKGDWDKSLAPCLPN